MKPPNPLERARDEVDLFMLSLWEHGWSSGEIVYQLECEGVARTRNSIIGQLRRILAEISEDERACG